LKNLRAQRYRGLFIEGKLEVTITFNIKVYQ